MSTRAFSVFHDAFETMNPGALLKLDHKLTLKVPDGHWVIIAKAVVSNFTAKAQLVECRLMAPPPPQVGDYDTIIVHLEPIAALVLGNPSDSVSICLTVVHTFSGSNTKPANEVDMGFIIRDQNLIDNVSMGQMKITAISVDALTNTPG
jgi:hypothetical protein